SDLCFENAAPFVAGFCITDAEKGVRLPPSTVKLFESRNKAFRLFDGNRKNTVILSSKP
ncbi:hypothetical protein GWI33_023211, partial [Rhynchophorus ferrugineus]